MRIFKLSLSLLFVLLGSAAWSEPQDMAADSAYCKASNAKYPRLKNIMNPAWKKSSQIPLSRLKVRMTPDPDLKLKQAMSEPMSHLNQLTHRLNSYYLSSIRDSLYIRLIAANESGLNIDKYKTEFKELGERCSSSDLVGKTFVDQAIALQTMPQEIETDYRNLHLQTMGKGTYLRKLVVAILEAHRLERVVTFLNKVKDKDLTLGDQRLIRASLEENERRLIRIHFAYPILRDFPTSMTRLMVERHFVSKPLGFNENKSIFYSHDNLEEMLNLAPAGQAPFILSKVPLAPTTEPVFAKYNANLYEKILSRKIQLPFVMEQALQADIDSSVKATIHSAQLKCENSSPCSALAVDPNLASDWIDALNENESLGPLACACRLNDQHTTISNNASFAIGAASAGSVVIAMAQPEVAPLVWAAYVLSVADMGTAALGDYDGFVNFNRTKHIVDLREGGSVSSLEDEQTRKEIDETNYNLLYDLGTGVIGMIPPARIASTYARQPIKALVKNSGYLKASGLELGKATSGIAAPDLSFGDYGSSWNPRRFAVPLPPEMRTQYPALLKNLQEVAAKGEFVSNAKARYALLFELKQAAEAMSVSGSAHDQELLAQGKIRAELCASAEAKVLGFVL